MLGMDYRYADQHVQSPSDKNNARAIARLIAAGLFPPPAPLPGRLSQDEARTTMAALLCLCAQAPLTAVETSRRVARGHLCHAHR
jgi:hypothetical protein